MGLVFYIIGVPIIWQCNQVIRRYAEEDAKIEEDKMLEIVKANALSTEGSPRGREGSPRGRL